MATRLNVLLIRPRSADDRVRLDHLVGITLGRPSLELLIIADQPADLPLDAPDRLTIETLRGPLASVAWMAADDLVDQLRRLGHDAVRGRHGGDPDIPTPAGGSLVLMHFDMRGDQDAESVLASLQTLAQSASTPTVSIGGPPGRGVAQAQPRPPSTIQSRSRPAGGDYDLDQLLDRFDHSDL